MSAWIVVSVVCWAVAGVAWLGGWLLRGAVARRRPRITVEWSGRQVAVEGYTSRATLHLGRAAIDAAEAGLR